MDDLNQFAISKILGSKIRKIGPVGFGHFNLRATTEEIQKALTRDDDGEQTPNFSYEEDAIVVQAFEDIRDGAPTDELLWNKELAVAFVRGCRELGLDAPHAYFIRRLLNVRKNSPRYKERGIEIRPASKSEAHPSIVPQYAHVIEFALVKLRYRFGVSIDDILMDPCFGEKFENLANQVVPSLSSEDLRLGALYIRKCRGIKRKELEKIQQLNLDAVEKVWQGNVSLAEVAPEKVPVSPGLIELREQRRFLYVAHNQDIHSAVTQFHTGEAFRLIANSFWQPKMEEITLHFVPGNKVEGIAGKKWEQKLIHDLDPVFNWPIPKKAA